MLIATTNDVPGYEIEEVLGEVFGLTVRSRNAFSQMGAGLKSIVGGELKGMTKNLESSRQEVIDRMGEAATARVGTPSWRCASIPPRWAASGPRSAPTAPPPGSRRRAERRAPGTRPVSRPDVCGRHKSVKIGT